MASAHIFRLSLVLAIVFRNICNGEKTVICNDRLGKVEVERYHPRTCAMCYLFLFPKGDKPLQIGHMYETLVPKPNASESFSPVTPDINNSSSIQAVCETLTSAECERWKACCQAAATCCQRQQKGLPVPAQVCPRTWDGFSCFDDTHPGVTATAQCPPYLEHAITSQRSSKLCTVNGTWYRNIQNQEWTDYRPCVDKQSHITGVYITVICCVISICLLLPSIIVFLVFRELLQQHRVRLHINFFISLLLCYVVTILWRVLVIYDTLVNQDKMDTVRVHNPVWCRVLSIAKIYLTSTNYFWMFCEGYYLHRLLSNAFEPPETLIALYLLGWACPAVSTIAYAIVIAVIKNESCWSQNIGSWQWIIYIPNLLCLLVNLIFLANILRILMFQLHAHPHEPSNFRRGLKAALMLVPLFGIQLFLTIYRPPPNSTILKEYDYITIIITNSQGVFVSLIFCFFNGELFIILQSSFLKYCQRRRFQAVPVLNHMRNTCPCCRWWLRRRRSQAVPVTSITQVSTYDDKRSPILSTRHPHDDNEVVKLKDTNGDMMELDDFASTNGSIKKAASPTKKGDYVSIPT